MKKKKPQEKTSYSDAYSSEVPWKEVFYVMKLPVLWNLLLQTPNSEVLDSHRQVINLFAVLLRK